MLQSSMMGLLFASNYLPTSASLQTSCIAGPEASPGGSSRRNLQNETPGEQQRFFTCADHIRAGLHLRGGGRTLRESRRDAQAVCGNLWLEDHGIK